MAKKLISASIATAQTIEAGHVSQSIKALTGTEAYDITISGSLTVTGSILNNGSITSTTGNFGAGGISIDSKFIDFSTPNLRIKNTGLNVFGGPLTGSIISASGDLRAGKLFIDEKSAIDTYVSSLTELTLNPDATWDAIRLHRDGSPKPINLNGDITASGNIEFTGNVSGSINSSYFGDEYNAHGGDANSGFTLLSLGSKPSIFASGASLEIGNATNSTQTGIHLVGEVTASSNISASGDLIGGGLNVVGISRMSSSASPSIVSVLTENDTHPFITGVTTTGPNFRMNLADADSSGSAYMAFGRQTGNFGGTGFTAHYATGSNASEGEIIMSIGKNGQLGQIQDRFIVQSEPGPIGSNTFSELSLLAGTHTDNRRVVQMVVQNGTSDFADVTVGNQDTATGFKKHVLMTHALGTSASIAGFASSSMNTGSTARNFNANSIPFGIVAGGPTSADLVDTVFFIDRGGTFGRSTPITASLEISRGGSISMEGGITASGTGLFQAGKPIITHTTSPISSSLVNAGRYHIVGGTLTASIVLDSNTPVGAEFEFFQTSSVGQFLFQSASGTTVISKNGSLRLAQQGSSAVLKKVSTTTFHLMGDLS
jgi:hypothetical protein